jgi:hypothetical protein
MDIEEAFAIMHPSLNHKKMQHHDKCNHGLSTWFPKADCRQCELLEIIDVLQAQARALSTEIARLERVYAGGL